MALKDRSLLDAWTLCGFLWLVCVQTIPVFCGIYGHTDVKTVSSLPFTESCGESWNCKKTMTDGMEVWTKKGNCKGTSSFTRLVEKACLYKTSCIIPSIEAIERSLVSQLRFYFQISNSEQWRCPPEMTLNDRSHKGHIAVNISELPKEVNGRCGRLYSVTPLDQQGSLLRGDEFADLLRRGCESKRSCFVPNPRNINLIDDYHTENCDLNGEAPDTLVFYRKCVTNN